jgi:spermidine synthase
MPAQPAETLIERRGREGGWIEVREARNRRSLWFDGAVLQSEIFLDRPGDLPHPANRAMLAHLMFGRTPRTILMAGCGGGAIARWFQARAPGVRGRVVELDAGIARLAREFFDFPASPDWELAIGDIRADAGLSGDRRDFILIDIEHGGLTPEWACSTAFLARCSDALTRSGVLTLNLLVDGPGRFRHALAAIRSVFPMRTLCLPVPEHDNIVVIAFARRPDLAAAIGRLPALRERWGLEFDLFLQRMRTANPRGSGVF